MIRLSIFLPLLVLVSCTGASTTRLGTVPVYPAHGLQGARNIAVIGDLQATTWPERVFLGRESNPDIGDHLLREILERGPEGILLLGDLVSEGGSRADWAAFDSRMKPCRDRGLAMTSVPGNHDYGFLREGGMRHYEARFGTSAGVINVTNLSSGVVLLTFDSNLDRFSQNALLHRSLQFRRVLDSLDRTAGVTGIIVAAHHPPFTNSDLPVDQRLVEDYAKPFLDAEKTILFLSGHVHSYERFDVGGKSFVISGGGGGPRREVETSSRRNLSNDCYRHGTLRPFHFLQIGIRDDRIVVETVMLREGTFVAEDSFTYGLHQQIG